MVAAFASCCCPRCSGARRSSSGATTSTSSIYEGGGKQAIVTDRWKAVRLNWNEQPDAPLELYDLQNDRAEEHSVAAQHPDIVRTMNERMAKSHTGHPGKTPPPT